ncbi:transposase [Neochlamydia sp. EPS4]|uniref:transposase n=1 Tax=Neochlamydia sp. EPS4 TaxID=1478175 RepID=UPI0009B5A41C|nr:transposase [Neochlamydia sp. EPS4]
MKTCLFSLFVYSQACLGECTGISFINSAILAVCHTHRIHSPPSFKKIAKRGKTSIGYFYGFKLHLAINDRGEMLAYMLAPGKVETQVLVSDLSKNIFGAMF